MFGKYVLAITHAQTVGHAGKFNYSSQWPTTLRYSLCLACKFHNDYFWHDELNTLPFLCWKIPILVPSALTYDQILLLSPRNFCRWIKPRQYGDDVRIMKELSCICKWMKLGEFVRCLTCANIHVLTVMPSSDTSCKNSTYWGADKSLARPGRKQARKHVRDACDFNNIKTRAVIKFFPPCKARCWRKFTPF